MVTGIHRQASIRQRATDSTERGNHLLAVVDRDAFLRARIRAFSFFRMVSFQSCSHSFSATCTESASRPATRFTDEVFLQGKA
jgi:hypothetical protein